MNRLHNIVAGLLPLMGLLVMASCTDENTFGEKYVPALKGHYLYLGATNIELNASSPLTKTVDVTTVTTPWRFSGMDTQWLTVQPVEGTTDATVNMTATENTSGDNIRTSVFQFQSTDASYNFSRQMSVTQSAANPYINVSPSQLTFTAAASSKTVAIESNIDWTLTPPQATWLTVTVDDNKKSITITVAENLDNRDRTTSFTLSGSVSQTVNVTQAKPGAPAANSASIDFDNSGGSFLLSITSEVAWTASTDEDWLQLTPGEGKAGTTQMQIDAVPNLTNEGRNGHVYLKIGGQQVVDIPVSQQSSFVQFDGSDLQFTADGGEQTLQLRSNVSWKVIEKPDWLSVSPEEGNSSQLLTISADCYWGTASRSGKLRIGQQGTQLVAEILVEQAGRTFDNLIGSLLFEPEEGTQQVTIATDGKWTASTTADWLTLNPTQGTGESTMDVTAAANTSDYERTAAISVSVGDVVRNIAVTQKGRYFTVTPATAKLPSKGGTHTVTIDTNEDWTAVSTSSWIELSASSGHGSQNVVLTAPDNPSVSSRTDTTTFTPQYMQPVRVVTTQEARYLNVSVAALSFFAKGGSAKVTVTTDATYTVSASASWLNITTDADGFTVKAQANDTGGERSATVTVAMTGLNEGEAYVLEMPVLQTAHKTNVDLSDFGEDHRWEIGTGKVTVTVVGFKADASWDDNTKHTVTIVVKGFGNDKSWDEE